LRRALLAIALVWCAGCGRGAASSASLPDGARPVDASAVVVSSDPKREELWARARRDASGADDLMRLADVEGATGLAERGGADPESRTVALQAMAFAPEPGAFAGFPFLAQAAEGQDETQAEAALDSLVDLAARPRRALDPEDAAEMKSGCDALLSVAKDPKAVRSRRVKAIRALRMLAERGCVTADVLPTDLDAR
jgi:hypothetical protein